MFATPLFAAFLTFLFTLIYSDIELTAGNMYSTIEIFSFFRIYINMFTCFGYQSILELSVVFDRMRGVLEIKEVQMTQIEDSKEVNIEKEKIEIVVENQV
jgi:hypothetical protein